MLPLEKSEMSLVVPKVSVLSSADNTDELYENKKIIAVYSNIREVLFFLHALGVAVPAYPTYTIKWRYFLRILPAALHIKVIVTMTALMWRVSNLAHMQTDTLLSALWRLGKSARIFLLHRCLRSNVLYMCKRGYGRLLNRCRLEESITTRKVALL